MNQMQRVQNVANVTLAQQTRMVGHSLVRNVTVPLMAMGGIAVNEFGKFDRAVVQTLSVMEDATPKIRQQIEEAAMLLSENTVTSAVDAAHAMHELAMTGLEVKGVLQALPVVNNFAIAGMVDQKRATELLTGAQVALGMQVRENAKLNATYMQELGDQLVKAANISQSGVEDLAVALTSKAGAAMRFFRIEAEQGIAALAVYADQNVKSELAGNSLDRTLRLLAKSALSNGAAWRMLGFSIYDQNGNWRDLADIMADLERLTAGLSAEQKAATLQMLGFEARSQQAITPLIGMSTRLREYTEEIKKAGGETQRIADVQMGAFLSQLEIAWNNIKNMGIEIGEVLAPKILWFNNTVLIPMAQAFRDMNPWLKEVVVVAGLLAAALGPVLIVVGGIMTLIGPLLPYITAMVAGIGNLIAAFGYLAAAGTTLGVVFTTLAASIAAVTVGWLLVRYASEAAREWTGFNEAIAKANELLSKQIELENGRTRKEYETIRDETSPEKKAQLLQEAVERSQKEVFGREGAVNAARSKLNEFGKNQSNREYLSEMMFGSPEKEMLQQELDEAQKLLDEAKSHHALMKSEAAKVVPSSANNMLSMLEGANIVKDGMSGKLSGDQLVDAVKEWEKGLDKASPLFKTVAKALSTNGRELIKGVRDTMKFGEKAGKETFSYMEKQRKAFEAANKKKAREDEKARKEAEKLREQQVQDDNEKAKLGLETMKLKDFKSVGDANLDWAYTMPNRINQLLYQRSGKGGASVPTFPRQLTEAEKNEQRQDKLLQTNEEQVNLLTRLANIAEANKQANFWTGVSSIFGGS